MTQTRQIVEETQFIQLVEQFSQVFPFKNWPEAQTLAQ